MYTYIYIYIYTHTHTCHEIYSSHKGNEMMSLAGKWMDPKIIMLSEISQAQKDKNHMCLLICGTQT
jgi:hypothetical protein